MTSTRQPKIQKVFEEMLTMQKAIGTRKDRFLKKFGLTRPQTNILYALSHGNKLMVKDVARQMGITSGAATQIIEGLVKAGYVERRHNQKDRRKVQILFCEEGKKQFEKFKIKHMERIGQVFEALDDQEIDLLIKLAQKISGRVQKLDKSKL